LPIIYFRGEVMKKVDKWFKPSRIDTGWHKTDSQTKRRRAALKAHKGSHLSAARACQQLSNITNDIETKKKSRADAKYFFLMYKKYGK
jgi:hypothetical protein